MKKTDQKRLSKQPHETRYVKQQAMISLEAIKYAKLKPDDAVQIKAGKLKRYLAYILKH